MSIKYTLKEIIIKSIEKYKLNITNNMIKIKYNKDNNSYITNIAIIIGNNINISPNDIAIEIKDELINHNIFEKIINNKGYLNFFIKKEYLTNYINNIIERKQKYGNNNKGNNKKINLTYINNNIINNYEYIKSIIYFDNLSRILSKCGYDIITEYYYNSNSSDKLLINNIKKELDIYRIYIEKYTNEKIVHDNNMIERFLSNIRYSNYCYINENELWLKTTEFGGNEDVLLIKEDGNYTPILSTITYNYFKINKNYDIIINISTNNSPDNQNILKSIIKIFKSTCNIIEINIPSINNNKTDILNQTEINELRYYFSNTNIDKDIDSNIITNLNNKFKYIEDTIIMITTILNKERKKIHNIDKYITFNNNTAYNIINKLVIYEDIIIESCNKLNPAIITDYTYELSELFHKFMDEEELIKEDDMYINERSNLLLAIKIVLKNSLSLIGIIPREEM